MNHLPSFFLQMVHKKCQNVFSLKKKKAKQYFKIFRTLSAAAVIGTLRIIHGMAHIYTVTDVGRMFSQETATLLCMLEM